jgi:hypothetical protein
MVAAFSTAAARVASQLDDHASGRTEPMRPLVERVAAMARELIHPAGLCCSKPCDVAVGSTITASRLPTREALCEGDDSP